MERKVYCPQNDVRPTAILYFTGAWQSYIWDCWCRIRSIYATRCVATLLAM